MLRMAISTCGRRAMMRVYADLKDQQFLTTLKYEGDSIFTG